ncbi:MAG: hypothetical protein AAGK21_07795 [Bacteroidota bacterium]
MFARDNARFLLARTVGRASMDGGPGPVDRESSYRGTVASGTVASGATGGQPRRTAVRGLPSSVRGLPSYHTASGTQVQWLS